MCCGRAQVKKTLQQSSPTTPALLDGFARLLDATGQTLVRGKQNTQPTDTEKGVCKVASKHARLGCQDKQMVKVACMVLFGFKGLRPAACKSPLSSVQHAACSVDVPTFGAYRSGSISKAHMALYCTDHSTAAYKGTYHASHAACALTASVSPQSVSTSWQANFTARSVVQACCLRVCFSRIY